MSKHILYVGSLDPHSNSGRRYKTFGSLGYETTGVDIDPFLYGTVFTKFHYHLNIGPGIWALNRKVLEVAKSSKLDLLLVDNKSYLTPGTLSKIKEVQPDIKMVNLITDDPGGKDKNTWRLSLKSAKYFDLHFVQRTPNLEELRKYGANRVEYCFRSFDPAFHRPIVMLEAERAKYETPVGFIGTYEADREAHIAYLIQNGMPVKIVGDGWPAGNHWKLIEPFYAGPSVYGEEYIKHINGMDIALHFLRKQNRDQQDSRTFEIPACRVFMLAERSALHEQFFKEDKEAVFFDSKEVLLSKVQYYLANEEARKQIAQAGFERSYASGYDHRKRLERMLESVFEWEQKQ